MCEYRAREHDAALEFVEFPFEIRESASARRQRQGKHGEQESPCGRCVD